VGADNEFEHEINLYKFAQVPMEKNIAGIYGGMVIYLFAEPECVNSLLNNQSHHANK
jgi:hypothetical protein